MSGQILNLYHLNLKPMAISDIPAVLAIEAVTSLSPWSQQIFQDCIRVGYSAWVGTIKDELVAYTLFAIQGPEAHILNIAVKPSWQRRGIGKFLLTHGLELFKTSGADTVFLEVRLSNTIAQRLYEDLGFIEVGRRHGYYLSDSGKEDALVYALSLTQSF